MQLNNLTAISPIDGRYHSKTQSLTPLMSEYGLIKYRVEIEVKWFLALLDAKLFSIDDCTAADRQFLETIYQTFSLEDAQQIKTIESTTNHDVKAVEYFIKEKLASQEKFKPYLEFVHFACTSEDINNLAYGRMLTDAKAILIDKMQQITTLLKTYAQQWHAMPMLARTHGQAATPTTLGKEFATFYHRANHSLKQLHQLQLNGKINGASGNFNAHCAAYPNVDWFNLAKQFVSDLGLNFNSHTTQIENHDSLIQYLQTLMRFNLILIDLSRDCWGYISLNYLTQKLKSGEVGSSTMPHKVNPIDFENAEGNFILANGLIETLVRSLPISRWQRDLVDSTLQRNLGSVCAYALIGFESLLKGLNKIHANETLLRQELTKHWEVLGEAIQTVMRKHGIENPYEQLKQFTRGKQLDQTVITQFIQSLKLPEADKQDLLSLTPETYIGLAATLASDKLT
ncbi:MAG: adenylosuccinate lyase [Pseudomonadota bacterium]